MEAFLSFLPLLFLLLMHPYLSSSLPVCTSLRAFAKEPLAFCPCKGRACCDSTKDSQMQMQFEAINISDPHCASLIKSILCTKCDQFSANLFKVESQIRSVPVLCNSPPPPPPNSSASSSFCTNVWETCQNVSMKNSSFSPSLSLQGVGKLPHNNTLSMLTDLWQSTRTSVGHLVVKKAAVSTTVSTRNHYHYQSSRRKPQILLQKDYICLERLGDKGNINMAGH